MRGSSPQARGTPRNNVSGAESRRIIPAGAGNSRSILIQCETATDHPRRRGELEVVPKPWKLSRGSSPQARGTPVSVSSPLVKGRIIPAGAGNSKGQDHDIPKPPDHPRRRGELKAAGLQVFMGIGSSPQARGTPGVCAVWRGSPRIIPAGAGNSSPQYRAGL